MVTVNTKNWYRKKTDLWAEFGKETPFGRKFSSKQRCMRSGARHHSTESCFALGKGSIREYVMTWPVYKEGTIWWWVQDGYWHRGINLGNKCCTRGRLGVVLGQGYKYEPLVFVIGIKQFHNKPAPCLSSRPLVESSCSSRGIIDPSTSVGTGNLVSCLVSCSGFGPWCK
jgi:hypothetical protein